VSFGNSWRIGGRKCSEDFADYDADGFGRARGGLAQQVLELDENLSIRFRFDEGERGLLCPSIAGPTISLLSFDMR
jgi:hypothetical protein